MSKFAPINIEDLSLRRSCDKTEVYKDWEDFPLIIGYYYPQNMDKSKKYPTLVFIHGGGWCERKIYPEQKDWSGDLLGYLSRYYADHGYVCVTIDYRLAPNYAQGENREVINCCNDCVDAIEHLTERFEENCIDTENITIIGESAGGYNSSFILFSDFKPLNIKFKNAVLVNPVIDMTTLPWKDHLRFPSFHPYLSDCESIDDVAEKMTHLRKIKKCDTKFFVIHGEKDYVVKTKEHGVAVYNALKEAGNDAELHIISGANHAFLLVDFYNLSRDHSLEAIEKINDFIERNT